MNTFLKNNIIINYEKELNCILFKLNINIKIFRHI